MGAFIADGVIKNPERPLRIILLSLNRSTYRVGEYLTCEIKIENVGMATQAIPWDPNVADVEPQGPTQAYEYQSLDISLWLTDHRHNVEALNLVSLYSTSRKTTSFFKLEHGQWVRLKAKAHLLFRDQQFKEAVLSSPRSEILVAANMSFGHARVTLQNGDLHEAISPDGPPQSGVNTERFELVSSTKPD
jgi:hypothetical protein